MAEVTVVSGGDAEHANEIRGGCEGDILPMEREEEHPDNGDMQQEKGNAVAEQQPLQCFVELNDRHENPYQQSDEIPFQTNVPKEWILYSHTWMRVKM